MQPTLTPSSPPFSLILSGGGMRCAWSAGFITRMKELGLVPKSIVTTSGNAGNSVYLALNQLDSIKRIWTEHLPGSRFIKWWRLNKIIDIDFLIDDVFRKREPMDFTKLTTTLILVSIACYNITQQKIDYFSNTTTSYEVLRATKALPIFYRKKITIENNKYTDSPIQLHTLINDQKHTLEKKILIVDVREGETSLISLLHKIMGGLVEKRGETFEGFLSIRPRNIKAGLLSNSKSVLSKTFNQGYEYATMHEKELRNYLTN